MFALWERVKEYMITQPGWNHFLMVTAMVEAEELCQAYVLAPSPKALSLDFEVCSSASIFSYNKIDKSQIYLI